MPLFFWSVSNETPSTSRTPSCRRPTARNPEYGTGTLVVKRLTAGGILGLFTHEGADNAFWVNPELSTAERAKKFLAREHVLGGDRLWIAPERGLFFKGDKLADGVETQHSI